MPARTYDSAHLSILLVDDDAIMLRMLEAMLRSDRHRPGLAGDADSALELFRSQTWDVVLTDYLMPGRNGAQLAQRIKEIAPEVPVILMTGYFGIVPLEDVDHPILHKPFRRPAIVAAINRCLAAEGAASPA
jgi:DNA-binding NtrC family response regulator